VLGAYHPVVAYNVKRLLEISGLDEVSFHMSGTEAVMQAVRLARYHTRAHLVRFCGAYHGWWGDVQPGVGNPLAAHETYTLRTWTRRRCACCARRRDIACVLVNPLQALHPNVGAPGDSTLVDSGRSAHFDRAAYAAWLQELREVCTRARHRADLRRGVRRLSARARRRAGIFRRARRHGDLRQDGRRRTARRRAVRPARPDARFREDRPADICFARGTFNSHPYVMGAMYEFLQRSRPNPCARSIGTSTPSGTARGQR
jgi:glutamate-1-semialdehyde 2,1-aminomutase